MAGPEQGLTSHSPPPVGVRRSFLQRRPRACSRLTAHLENYEGDHLGCCKRPDDKDRDDGGPMVITTASMTTVMSTATIPATTTAISTATMTGTMATARRITTASPNAAEARECRLAGKALVCHVPPGDPENAHELCINWPAVPAHLENHDDFSGCCRKPYDLR